MIEDLLRVYRDAGRKTLETIKTQPLALLLPLGLHLLFTLVDRLSGSLSRTGLLAGFILAIIYALITSLGLSQYDYLIRYQTLNRGNPLDQARAYFTPVYSVYFILMILSILLGSLPNAFGPLVLLYFIFNPLPEVLYISQRYGLDAMKKALEFTKANFLHWLLALGLYILLSTLILGWPQVFRGLVFSDIVDQMLGFRPYLGGGISQNTRALLAQILTGFYMVYRGHLYKNLATSSRRKRDYMGAWQ
ncbi:MAG: hypothetical protein Q4E37_05075 [Tissierellia bacterium]|nr:hypothetical protein [Tissierellia bacterium]